MSDPQAKQTFEDYIKVLVEGHIRDSKSSRLSPTLFLLGRTGVFPSQMQLLKGVKVASKGLDVPFVQLKGGTKNHLYPCFKNLDGTKSLQKHHGVDLTYYASIESSATDLTHLGFGGIVDKVKGFFSKPAENTSNTLSQTYLSILVKNAEVYVLIKVKVSRGLPALPVEGLDHKVLARYTLDPASIEVTSKVPGLTVDSLAFIKTKRGVLPWFDPECLAVLAGGEVPSVLATPEPIVAPADEEAAPVPPPEVTEPEVVPEVVGDTTQVQTEDTSPGPEALEPEKPAIDEEEHNKLLEEVEEHKLNLTDTKKLLEEQKAETAAKAQAISNLEDTNKNLQEEKDELIQGNNEADSLVQQLVAHIGSLRAKIDGASDSSGKTAFVVDLKSAVALLEKLDEDVAKLLTEKGVDSVSDLSKPVAAPIEPALVSPAAEVSSSFLANMDAELSEIGGLVEGSGVHKVASPPRRNKTTTYVVPKAEAPIVPLDISEAPSAPVLENSVALTEQDVLDKCRSVKESVQEVCSNHGVASISEIGATKGLTDYFDDDELEEIE